MDLANKLFRGDRVIWIIFMFLCAISLVEVFSATSTLTYKQANHWAPIVRHASFLLAGVAAVLILHNIPTKVFSLGVLLLPASIILLAITPFVGVEVNGAKRWLDIGFLFQPSEIAKLSCVIFVAFFLSKRKLLTEKQIFYTILIGTGLVCGIIFLDNISTAVMLFGICFLMMFIGQLPFKYLFGLAASCLLGVTLLVSLMFIVPDHIWGDIGFNRVVTAKSRLLEFVPEESAEFDPKTYKITDENYQVSHAKIAIARGGTGLFGQLPGHGQQRDFLPQAYSDFIYAIIIEEMGVIGGLFVLFLYIVLLVRVGMIARKCEKLFPKFLVLGCGLLVVVQALANMAVAVNLIPVTGQPMPLVSRGGTSTVISCIYFGIILSVSRFGAHMDDEEEELSEGEKENVVPTLTEEEIANWVPDAQPAMEEIKTA